MTQKSQQQFQNSSSSIQTNSSPLESSQSLAWTIAEAADTRKAADIVLLKVAEVSYLTDYFVIITGFSRPQVQAIADAIYDGVKEKWQRTPLRKEGYSDGNWILQDYGEVIVHIMLPKEREFYDLEAFWGHAERLEFSEIHEGQETRS